MVHMLLNATVRQLRLNESTNLRRDTVNTVQCFFLLTLTLQPSSNDNTGELDYWCRIILTALE